jgi:hypothetical protein
MNVAIPPKDENPDSSPSDRGPAMRDLIALAILIAVLFVLGLVIFHGVTAP